MKKIDTVLCCYSQIREQSGAGARGTRRGAQAQAQDRGCRGRGRQERHTSSSKCQSRRQKSSGRGEFEEMCEKKNKLKILDDGSEHLLF